MSRRSLCCLNGLATWAATWGLVAAVVLPAGAQAPAGAELQVNSYTTSFQISSSVAAASNGDFVVVWNSNGSPGTDTADRSIQGQRYASGGSAQGAQFQVNSYTTSGQYYPSVAAAASGSFVVVWDSDAGSGTDTSSHSIQGQLYASNGSAQGVQFQVNTYTTNQQQSPSVAAEANGDFVVVWHSNGSPGTDTDSFSIQGQRYASNGSPQGGQFQVNSYTTSFQRFPSVAADADGDFVVVWSSDGSPVTDTNAESIQGQRYASNGSPQGAQFQVNTYTTSTQRKPDVAADANGNFFVVWESIGSYETDPAGFSIQGQRFASNGTAQGAQFQVNNYTPNSQYSPSVVAASNGDFVVVWESLGSSATDTTGFSIQGRRFASDGSMLSLQFQVNTYTTNSQEHPSVAAGGDRDFVVVWESYGSSGTDTSSYSIHGQRYRAPVPVPAMSAAGMLACVAALMLLGATVALRRRS